jgi:hypothetical protein
MIPARKAPLGYREQEHADEPNWGIQKFPAWLHRKIKIRAAVTDRTITEVLADELGAVAERLEKDPDARAPEIPKLPDSELMPYWPIKHFPEALRLRLKEIGKNEAPKTPLYQLVIRELAQASEGWD